jgi:hypothetical protein
MAQQVAHKLVLTKLGSGAVVSASILEAEIRYVDAEQCLAWHDNVQIIFSLEPPSFDFMKKIVSELALLARQTGFGTGALLIISSEVSPPTEEARSYIRRELERSSMLAAAQVVEGTGFRGAAMRSVLSLMQLTTRAPYAMKIFDSVVPGAFWLAGELERKARHAPSGSQLSDAVQSVRKRFLARGPARP